MRISRVLIAEKKYSNHPADEHLSIRIYLLNPNESNKEYVVWLHNKTDRGNSGGFYSKDLIDATNNYNSRGVQD